jgi:hypothetical protein
MSVDTHLLAKNKFHHSKKVRVTKSKGQKDLSEAKQAQNHTKSSTWEEHNNSSHLPRHLVVQL